MNSLLLVQVAGLAGVARAEESALNRFLIKLGELRLPSKATAIPDGRTWGDLTFLERVRVYDWTTELYVLATFAVFIAFYVWGASTNKSRVYRFVDAVRPTLDENFGYVGCAPGTLVVKDSDARYTTYASGRANVESLLARFRLSDRQNIMNYALGLVVPALASIDGRPDHIEITLTPTDPRAIEPGIFGIANKENLQEAQEENYFFTVAKAVDSDALPPVFIFILEHADQAGALLTPELARALSLEGADKVLRWLGYSDLPATPPKTEAAVSGHRKLTLNLAYPRTAAQYEAARQILGAALGLVDALVSKPAYRGSVLKRVKANRDGELAKIRKAEEAAKKEEIEAKKAEERREAARRERNLSEKEQRRLQKKEQEKQARKQKHKMTKKA